MTTISPYLPRMFHFDGVWLITQTAVKVYTITRSGDPFGQGDLLECAKAYTSQNLPALVEAEGHDHGLGYVILHAGEMSNWLLVHWWAYGDIALRLLASCDHGTDHFVSQDHRRFHACVWEHVVINYERDAWVRHMSREDRLPQHYLNDRLPDDAY